MAPDGFEVPYVVIKAELFTGDERRSPAAAFVTLK
jgi:hypothetical protein